MPLILLLTLGACSKGREATTPSSPVAASSGTQTTDGTRASTLFADGATGPSAPSPGNALTLSIAGSDRGLMVERSASRAALTQAGAGASLNMALTGIADAEERRLVADAGHEPSERDHVRLDVAAHRLPWSGARLLLALQDAHGQSVAHASAPLAPALAATARARVPAVTLVGERIGRALAFSADGNTLAVSRPSDEALLLYPSGPQPDEATDDDGRHDPARIEVDGLGDADHDSMHLALATFASTVAVTWQDGDGRHVSIHTAHGEGWIRSHRATVPAAGDASLHVAPDGDRVDLLHDDGRIDRFTRSDDTWTGMQQRPADDAPDAMTVRTDGRVLQLRHTSEGWWLDGADGTPPARLPVDATTDPETIVSSRLAIDAGERTLAVATLIGPKNAARARTELRIWTRDAPPQAWRAAGAFERGLTAADARQTLTFGSANGLVADTLLWSWNGPSERGDAGDVSTIGAQPDAQANAQANPHAVSTRIAARDEAGQTGLLVLTDREPVAAFGRAARSDLVRDRWHPAFALPRDGGAFGATAAADVAVLSVDGTRLAIGFPPDRAALPLAPGYRTAAVLQNEPTRDGPSVARPAGVVRLLD